MKIRSDFVTNSSSRKSMKAINIKWDTDGDADLFKSLPSEIEIPEEIAKNNDDDEISDYITNQTGFCHLGFDII